VLAADVPSICRTHNGVSAQFGLIAELYGQVARAPTLGAKLRLLLDRPALAGPRAPLRPDAAIPAALKVYVGTSFVTLVALAAWLLWFRGQRPLPVQMVSAMTVVFGLYWHGALLDGRLNAQLREAIRLVATAGVGGALWFHEPATGVVVALAALAGLVVLGVVLPRAGAGAAARG
jgi:hypothetical protein